MRIIACRRRADVSKDAAHVECYSRSGRGRRQGRLKQSIIFTRVVTRDFGMEHYVPKLYKVYINDDSELTLTYFTAMSNFAELVFVLIVGPDIR